jgi:hypothetical protein
MMKNIGNIHFNLKFFRIYRKINKMKNDIESSKAYLCEADSTNIILEWESFNEWLISEINRLSQMYNISGVEYNDDAPICHIF